MFEQEGPPRWRLGCFRTTARVPTLHRRTKLCAARGPDQRVRGRRRSLWPGKSFDSIPPPSMIVVLYLFTVTRLAPADGPSAKRGNLQDVTNCEAVRRAALI